MEGLKIDNNYLTAKEYSFKYKKQRDWAHCRNYYRTFKEKN